MQRMPDATDKDDLPCETKTENVPDEAELIRRRFAQEVVDRMELVEILLAKAQQ